MSSDRWPEVERLYERVVALPIDQRAAFLDEACLNDAELRRQVEDLIDLESEATDFLERPALRAAASTLSNALPHLKPPDVPGYTIIRELGEGGMGVVYLAEQRLPLQRTVALKLIRPGMDSRQVLARFERERQALARMDHPNIAAVFDAGSTADGRPYFVMEFVDGVPITEYCDSRNLSIRARLALFIQVCSAVQHAHQKGVIHRDLKPSNVLVMDQDGQPVPKVIDFGTAKAADPTGEAVTIRTDGLVFGTVEYMSPEQAALSADIDTSTDVYSLGVLLYELLVGRLPFDMDELRTAGYDEIRRVIRESDPPRPSVRAGQTSDNAGHVARARQTDPLGLTRQLRGDLDWITLKALEKDRSRRYAAAAALSADIERFLSDQPVEARPPSSAYRIRKFTRRHRFSVAAAGVILTILGTGLVATTGLYWQVRTALRETNHFAYAATLAAAAGDLRIGAAADAQARLLTVPQSQRDWEWRHLFVQTDESSFSFSSATPRCGPGSRLGTPHSAMNTTALRLDADGESILLRRCRTLERWSVATLVHTAWTSPREESIILAESARGKILTVHTLARYQLDNGMASALPREALSSSYQLVLNDRSGSAVAVAFGPFATSPICADISPDGTRIALGLAQTRAVGTTAGDGEVFEVWDVATSRLAFRLTVAPPVLPDARGPNSCMVRFSADGRRVATSGATVHVWDAALGTQRAADSGQAGSYRQPVAFSRDGNRLAIGRASGLVDVLNLSQASSTLIQFSGPSFVVEESVADSGRIVERFLRSKREVVAVAFSPDDQTVVSGTATTVGVWDIGQSKLVRVLSGHETNILDVAVSADGGRIYSVDMAGVVRGWPSRSAAAVVRLPGSFSNYFPFPISADGSVTATAKSNGELTAIRLSDFHQEVVRGTGGLTQPLSMAISPDGLHLYTAEATGWVRKWPIGPQETAALSSKALWIDRLTVSPGGSVLVGDRHGRSVAFWDTSTMKLLSGVDLLKDPGGWLSGPLFLDEDTLITSNRVLPLLDNKLSGPNSGTQNVTARDRVAEQPEVVLGHAWLIRTWNWRTNRELAILDPKTGVGRGGTARPAAISPDRQRIVLILSNRGETTVSIWDGELKIEVGRLPPGDYHAVAFSPDGRRMVSVGAVESAVRIWDADQLRELLTLVDTDSHLGGVAFTPTGQIVAARSKGGLTIWDTQIRQR